MAKEFSNKTEEDALRYLEQNFVQSDGDVTPTAIKSNLSYLDGVPSNEYMVIPLTVLPCGIFYKPGSKIMIRAARVQEVQAYSVVDDNNYLDITEKMNQILSSCIKYYYPDGTLGSYKDVRDGDRLFLIFMIRELTFPGGKNLMKDVTCGNCGHEFKMELRATSSDKVQKTFVNHEMPEKILKFFNPEERAFVFDIDGVTYKLAPPTIGIQEAFFGDIKTKVQGDKNPNSAYIAFLKFESFMLYDRSKISEDGLKAKEQEYKRMDMKTFQILNQAIGHMVFGIKEMVSICPSCGQEVHTDMSFPAGASNIFVISDSLEQYFG